MLNKYGEAYSNLTVPNHYNETDVGLYVCEYGSGIKIIYVDKQQILTSIFVNFF